MSRRAIVLVLAAVFLVATVPAVVAGTKLLRFPDIHGDRVVFSYAGDLWLAPAGGGDAVRLTAHPGVELFPRFSPDGEWVAFTGQYDGDEQVYVVSVRGGMPRQLTFYPARGPLPPRWGYDNQVYDWTADGTRVLFRSLRASKDLSDSRLFLVDVAGGLPEPLPMPEAGGGDLSPDGAKVVYSPLFRDFRTWKRYEGGWAQELYVFDLASHDLVQVTDHPRADRDPMWIGDTIWFTSDRDGTNNLYAYDVATGSTEQRTTSTTWDVRWPADDGEGRIVYESAGELVVFDVASGTSTPISIHVPDDGVSMRPSRTSVAGNLEDAALSPKGERAVVVARGDVFTVPIENGPTRNLTNSSGAHDKGARWSPDGRRIAFLSDRTGEEEIWLVEQDGNGEPVQLTDDGDGMRYAPEWSPDGKSLAFDDKEGRLYVLDVETKAKTLVADEASFRLGNHTWSPDSRHIAFSMSDDNGYNSIFVWSREDGQVRRVTDDTANDGAAAWDPKGEYLFFLSDREFAPQIGSIEWNYLVDRETAIYAVALRPDVAHPFWPESDEVAIDGADAKDAKDAKTEDGDEPAKASKKKTDRKKAGDKKDAEDGDAPAPIEIAWDGLGDRVVRVPVEADNYGQLTAVEGHLLFVRGGPFYYGRGSDVETELRVFSMEDREASTIATGVGGYTVSGDGKKALVFANGGLRLYDVKPKPGEPKSVSLGGLQVDRVPREEWNQIFDEVWRRFRDFFYVDNMHGYDWAALREQYRPLLDHVAHRSDLNYVIGEMIAELNVGHAYIQGGDWDSPSRPSVALPGAVFELDRDAGRYRIADILAGDNQDERYRTPLTEVGVDARVGDYVLAIDGVELTASDNPYRLLQHKGAHPVTLTLNAEPSTEGARQVAYRPIGSEQALRYHGWVAQNRERVAELSEGALGYLHIPDMGADGIREFIRWYYPQIRKQGLVIDVRGNGGGNVSQMIIERLNRKLLGVRFARTNDRIGTYPNTVFHGHLVCLLDEDSASDGDIFPYRFKKAGLGPLIGKRSWGGVVGITNQGTLIDGGSVFVPQFGTNDVDGAWAVEGYGVDPDIEVDNDPKSVLAGGDPQLERGVRELLDAIARDPKTFPARPAPPVKTP
jgi:tricorn protease